MKVFGAVEGGGTKFICMVANSPGEIQEEVRIPTTTPEETLSRVCSFLVKFPLESIGVGIFGPLDLDPSSPAYGSITRTPKPGWSGFNVLAFFKEALSIPITLEVDVNAAVFGEHSYVADNRSLSSIMYMTIGTGIGAGFLIHGALAHGLVHPEAGHVLLPHDRIKDPFAGSCPFHQDCFEGLASGPAIKLRWNIPPEEMEVDHPAWDLEAEYIATALMNVILTVSPQRIILGGGVMQQKQLFPMIRDKVRHLLKGYIASQVISGPMDAYIVPPGLGNRSGVLGTLAMAQSLSIDRR
jgi:fructokinase